MTYFGFLLKFLALPLVVLFLATQLDWHQRKGISGFQRGRAVWWALGLHMLLAILYTTPWDNYLVATRVWYYDPKLISGTVLGWVPIEEYIFFILETALTGLWWWFLVRRLELYGDFRPARNIRILSMSFLGVVWLGAVFCLGSELRHANYLSLILVWALPVLMLQLVFGADILWHYRRLIIIAILPVFLYISAADSLAIASGTWTINPAQSMEVWVGGLPIEETVFFLVTVTIICFGMTLSLAHASQVRWNAMVHQIPAIAWVLSRAQRQPKGEP